MDLYHDEDNVEAAPVAFASDVNEPMVNSAVEFEEVGPINR